MSKNGLTLTIVFEGSSGNYGEGFGNVSQLKKLTRADGNVYSDDLEQYTIFSLWDTYRTASPLMTIIDGEKAASVASTFMNIYNQQGKLPVWHLAGNETNCMVGNPGVIVLADLALKGYVKDVPAAIEAMAELLEEPFERYPYMMKVLGEMLALDRFSLREYSGDRLTVTVYSFSFKKGVPYDPSGNGGGYVFDCRSIHNPGRYEPYKKLTGRDEPVIRFLEEDGEVFSFLEHVYGVVDPHVETYSRRGFTSLMVSFGCTGGQHRSVYCAEHLAAHLAQKYPSVRVTLTHREQQ